MRTVRAAGSDGGTTAEGLEDGFLDGAIFFIDLDLELHDITTGGSSNETSSNSGFVFAKGPNIPWILIMINNQLVVGKASDWDHAQWLIECWHLGCHSDGLISPSIVRKSFHHNFYGNVLLYKNIMI